MLDSSWTHNEEEDVHELRLGYGPLLYGLIRRRGGDSIYAPCWIATLNGRLLTDSSSDLAYAKGRIECEIVQTLMALADGFRAIKKRAPTADDIFPDGAWARWKGRRIVDNDPPSKD